MHDFSNCKQQAIVEKRRGGSGVQGRVGEGEFNKVFIWIETFSKPAPTLFSLRSLRFVKKKLIYLDKICMYALTAEDNPISKASAIKA